MKTVKKELSIEFYEKKSKFIGYIKPVNTVKEANKFIERINNLHMDATHNVYAYKLIENNQEYLKYNDCGEPLNTAGKPMAQIIDLLDVTNIVIVATRYFGGIKLGAGGLIRNYAKCAKLAINEAEIIPYIEKKEYLLEISYANYSDLENILEKNNIDILDRIYNENVMLKVKISEDQLNKLHSIKGISIIKLED